MLFTRLSHPERKGKKKTRSPITKNAARTIDRSVKQKTKRMKVRLPKRRTLMMMTLIMLKMTKREVREEKAVEGAEVAEVVVALPEALETESIVNMVSTIKEEKTNLLILKKHQLLLPKRR